MKFTFLRFDSIDSTNIEALKQARKGAVEGSCVIARQQTAGRGRQGRTWSSPVDAGLYLSIVLKPRLDARDLPLSTLAAAVAVFDALVELGLKPDIKWPNDVLVNDKKVCGILAETTDTDEGIAVVVGIGINLTADSFPPELAGTAASLEAELGRFVSSAEIENSLLDKFSECYERLYGPDGPAAVIGQWSQRSSYARGKPVRATLTNEVLIGVTDGIESNGALRIVDGNGTVHIVQAGDVERLRTSEQFD